MRLKLMFSSRPNWQIGTVYFWQIDTNKVFILIGARKDSLNTKSSFNKNENFEWVWYNLFYFSFSLSPCVHSHTSIFRPRELCCVHTFTMKNKKNACKVGQSNETTILAAVALTSSEGRREKAGVAFFFSL